MHERVFLRGSVCSSLFMFLASRRLLLVHIEEGGSRADDMQKRGKKEGIRFHGILLGESASCTDCLSAYRISGLPLSRNGCFPPSEGRQPLVLASAIV